MVRKFSKHFSLFPSLLRSKRIRLCCCFPSLILRDGLTFPISRNHENLLFDNFYESAEWNQLESARNKKKQPFTTDFHKFD
ncbi:hypothetical protein OUZ56_001234 [Daphnia magna]|uniref:Uncharacterized protein n=1 Tax=Daphnia magna TaxID=35525 RepID=A0ABR0A2Q3_9CRUS|nr:hypothetical protein OUZ56_001234 [Daphnia magna]